MIQYKYTSDTLQIKYKYSSDIAQIQYKHSSDKVQTQYSYRQYTGKDQSDHNKYRAVYQIGGAVRSSEERCGVARSGAEKCWAVRSSAERRQSDTESEPVRISGKPPASCRLDRSVQLGCGAHIVGPKAPVPLQVESKNSEQTENK